jgi:hypothetical protein
MFTPVVRFRYNKGGKLKAWKTQLPACHSTLSKKERSMTTLPNFQSTGQLFTPRPDAKMFFADYEGFNGVLSITDAHQVIFKTPGTAWYPLMDLASLVVLGQVDLAMQQVVLDDMAGGYVAVCTSRRQEV